MRVVVYRKRVRHLTAKNYQPSLFDPDHGYYEYSALVTNSAGEFEVYICSNAGMIPIYAERRRYGERVSTGFVESAINTVVGKRFCRRQQIHCSKPGANLMLQLRTRTLGSTSGGSSGSGIQD